MKGGYLWDSTVFGELRILVCYLIRWCLHISFSNAHDWRLVWNLNSLSDFSLRGILLIFINVFSCNLFLLISRLQL